VAVDAEGRVAEIYLCENNLTGPLPSELQQMPALTFLYLDSNQRPGGIAAELEAVVITGGGNNRGSLHELTELSTIIPRALFFARRPRSLLLSVQ
jgi:hypothetical protein